jgi:hypothetical protein
MREIDETKKTLKERVDIAKITQEGQPDYEFSDGRPQ